MSKSHESLVASVELNNIFSYEYAHFEFARGVTLLEGFNYDDNTPEGSGKSSIPNALCWGIFGKIPKDAKVDEVIREGAESGSVKVNLRDGNQVVRSRKPNDLYYATPEGHQIRGKDARETQTMIEALFGMGFETFCQAVYFAQNYPAKFISATEAERAKIISEIQDLEAFTDARKKAAKLLSDQTIELERLRNGVESQEAVLGQLRPQIAGFEQMRTSYLAAQAARLAKLKEETRELNEKAEALGQDLKSLNAPEVDEKLKELLQDQSDLQVQLNKLKVELGSLEETARTKAQMESDLARKNEELIRVQAEFSTVSEDLGSYDANQALREETEVCSDLEALEEVRTQIKADLLSLKESKRTHDRLTAELSRKKNEFGNASRAVGVFQESKQKLCPECGSVMNAEHAKKHLKEKNNALEAMMNEIDELREELERQGPPKNSEELEANLTEVEAGIQTAKAAKNALEKRRRDQDVLRRSWEILSTREASLKREGFLLIGRIGAITVSDASDLSAGIEELEAVLKEVKVQEAALRADLIRIRDVERELAVVAQDLKRVSRETREEAARDTQDIDARLEALRCEERIRSENTLCLKSKYDEVQILVGRLETLKGGFQEVKQYVFKGLLAQLTKKANKYLVELFDVPVSIKFSNEDEGGEVSKISVSVKLDGNDRSLGLYSGGQFRRISLAVDLALSDIISERSHNAANLRILDEPFKDLSEVSMERALKLFDSLQGCTVLIEHNSMVKSVVNQTYRVELRDGISKVVQ